MEPTAPTTEPTVAPTPLETVTPTSNITGITMSTSESVITSNTSWYKKDGYDPAWYVILFLFISENKSPLYIYRRALSMTLDGNTFGFTSDSTSSISFSVDGYCIRDGECEVYLGFGDADSNYFTVLMSLDGYVKSYPDDTDQSQLVFIYPDPSLGLASGTLSNLLVNVSINDSDSNVYVDSVKNLLAGGDPENNWYHLSSVDRRQWPILLTVTNDDIANETVVLIENGARSRTVTINGSFTAGTDLTFGFTNDANNGEGFEVYSIGVMWSANTTAPTKTPTSPPITMEPTSDPTAPTTEPTSNPFAGSFGDIIFDSNSTFNFSGNTRDIGWLQFSICSEGGGHSVYNPNYTVDDLFDLTRYAITVQIGPSNNTPGVSEDVDYTNTADICSNPVFALNNQYEMSYTLNMTVSPPVISDYANTDNWIGTSISKNRLVNTCFARTSLGSVPHALYNVTYWGCGNHDAFAIIRIDSRCYLDYLNNIGYDPQVWLGFDLNQEAYCQFNDSGDYTLIGDSVTGSPTTVPTLEPTKSPTVLMLQELEPFVPSYGTMLGYIDILNEMYLELYFTVHSLPSGWYNMFHCGTSNVQRLPSIFILGSAGFYVMIADGVIENGGIAGGDLGFGALSLNHTYHMEVMFNQSWFSVDVDGETIFEESKSNHSLYDTTPCYASFPNDPVANVTIFNLTMWSTEAYPTMEPTEQPTAGPTNNPSLQPTANPSNDSGIIHEIEAIPLRDIIIILLHAKLPVNWCWAQSGGLES